MNVRLPRRVVAAAVVLSVAAVPVTAATVLATDGNGSSGVAGQVAKDPNDPGSAENSLAVALARGPLPEQPPPGQFWVTTGVQFTIEPTGGPALAPAVVAPGR